MDSKLELVLHGRGNAWPVPLGEEHPFYNRKDPRDLGNASYSMQLRDQDGLQASVLIDAGHGTVQSLLAGDNRIPDCICLTHGHLDHTLSVDWVVQSFWRKHDKEKRYPLHASEPVYRVLLQSYPHLGDLTEHHELQYGISFQPVPDVPMEITAFPAYHGQSAVGASMLLFEHGGRRILFTGDILAPLLRREDYAGLQDIDMLVVDANNRFPWPRTNHWSFAGSPQDPMERSRTLEEYTEHMDWALVSRPQLQAGISAHNQAFLFRLEQEWDPAALPMTILEFMKRIGPRQVMLVHYSGAEDRKYSNEELLSARGLENWASRIAQEYGIPGEIMVPESGHRLELN